MGGQPLIAWTIQAACNASLARIIVSTDDDDVAAIAIAAGAEVPFRRPAELCDDLTPSGAAALHALAWARSDGENPRYVLLLQPTSPLRTSEDIDAALDIAFRYQADSVVSVTPAAQHPAWMKLITETGMLTNLLDSPPPLRRQDLPPVFILNGAIYIGRSDLLHQTGTLVTGPSYPYIMPAERSLDVDTPWDLYLADLVLRNRISPS